MVGVKPTEPVEPKEPVKAPPQPVIVRKDPDKVKKDVIICHPLSPSQEEEFHFKPNPVRKDYVDPSKKKCEQCGATFFNDDPKVLICKKCQEKNDSVLWFHGVEGLLKLTLAEIAKLPYERRNVYQDYMTPTEKKELDDLMWGQVRKK